MSLGKPHTKVYKDKEIVFYGPLGVAKNVLGGGEAGNKKTIDVLEGGGIKVNILEKPYLIDIPILRGVIGQFQYLGKILKFIFNSIFKFSEARVFHLSGFYLNLIYYENIFISVAKLLGYKTIYEVRAGGMISEFNIRNSFYRYVFRKTMLKVDVVLSQGEENCEFLSSELGVKSIYYPNFILDDLLPKINNVNRRLNDSKMRIIYTGRISPSKQIHEIIEIGKALKDKHKKFLINIIGDGGDEYLLELKEKTKDYGLSEYVHFLGRMNINEINKILGLHHFFLFPTKEKREGHSNSLTEAMSHGVVPISSNIGYNGSVIANNELIIETSLAQDYAQKMINIFESPSLWQKYSCQMFDRVKNNYTERLVSNRLLAVYNDFFSN